MNLTDERKIIAYKVIRSSEACLDLNVFSDECQKLIDDGFQPYCEPQIKQPPGSYFIQAFVKYKEFVHPSETKVTLERIQT